MSPRVRSLGRMSVRLADMPRAERPRERLWTSGPRALSTSELLALVLRNGRTGEGAIALATSLLARFGDLARLASAEPEELVAHPGMGPAKAAALLGALELGRRLGGPAPERLVVRRPEDLVVFAQRELAGLRRERVSVFVLDAGNRLLRTVPVSAGSADRCPLPVREVLNAVLRNDGSAFVVAHNHPSGDPRPSRHDRRLTAELSEAAGTVGLRLLDHLVVAERGWSGLGSLWEARPWSPDVAGSPGA